MYIHRTVVTNQARNGRVATPWGKTLLRKCSLSAYPNSEDLWSFELFKDPYGFSSALLLFICQVFCAFSKLVCILFLCILMSTTCFIVSFSLLFPLSSMTCATLAACMSLDFYSCRKFTGSFINQALCNILIDNWSLSCGSTSCILRDK